MRNAVSETIIFLNYIECKMNKQIIINGSHNRDGDTTKLIQEIYPEIACLKLIDYTIELYNDDETYSDKDQFLEIINQIIEVEEIIFATLVYWYSMSSVMKISLID